MEKVKIIVPSRGRANNVSTKKVVNDIIIVCPFDEYEEYKEHNPDIEIIQRPKEVMGISLVRQYILDKFEDPFMIDDDIEGLRRLYEEDNEKAQVFTSKEIEDIINHTKFLSEELGAKMYGFTHKHNPVIYEAFRPYLMTGFICASSCGFNKNHGLRENIDIISADDYYMSGLNMYHNRFNLFNTRYVFKKIENFKNAGGLQMVRNTENIKNDTLILREHFGDVITIKGTTTFKHSTIEGERTLTAPF